jgi:hypothetical protein
MRTRIGTISMCLVETASRARRITLVSLGSSLETTIAELCRTLRRDLIAD